ncbi:chitinase [Clonorchis sinensis]|uniref:Chitinase n=1 Tax=Clonorchis sinensis TaxID=79923 RepID=G7YKP2_CLOSI|nr:chitinase [Clonorchis sinensis]
MIPAFKLACSLKDQRSMNWSIYIFVLLGHVTIRSLANTVCVPDPCDSCNSEQTCMNGVCEPAGGNPCDGVVCGTNAACIHGSCRCNSGFEGNPAHGCTPVVASPVEQLLTRNDWDALFPNRWFKSPLWHLHYTPQQPWYYPQMEVDYYSYENFIDAVKSMEASGHGKFLNEPGTSLEDRKRELCAFIGNIAHETGEGDNGLFYREELGYERTHGVWNGGYRSVGSRSDYKMGETPVYFRNTTKLAGKIRFNSASYHGRGPLQLSWGYNYGDFSKAVYGDPQVLLNNPDRLLDEPKLGISAAIWFWMTQPDWRMTHNPHNVIYKQLSSLKPWGFGRTIMAINGGLEQNAVENGASDADKKVTRRIKNYRRCAEYLKIPVGVDGEQLDTKGMWN